MALVHFFLNEMLDDVKTPPVGILLEPEFRSCPVFQHPKRLRHRPLRCGSVRSCRRPNPDTVPSPQSGKDEYRVSMDVQQFEPEELKVTVVEGFLVVEGRHEERSDEHGLIARHFTRRYNIPDDVDTTTLASEISTDGVLTLRASILIKEGEVKTREIPITHTMQKHQIQESSKKDSKTQETVGTN